LVNRFDLLQSFGYTPYLFYKKTVQIKDEFFLCVDHEEGRFNLYVSAGIFPAAEMLFMPGHIREMLGVLSCVVAYK
jgi:hypothetical protein